MLGRRRGMKLTHPLHKIPTNQRKRTFAVLSFATVLIMVILNISSRPLTTSVATNGIISYEFAGDRESAQDILDSWDSQAKVYAAFNLGLDYLFLVLYSASISAGVLWLTDALTNNRRTLRLAQLLAWSLVLAAFLDAIENSALFTILINGATEPWPRVASVAAGIKFALVIIGLLYVLIGLIVRLGKRLS